MLLVFHLFSIGVATTTCAAIGTQDETAICSTATAGCVCVANSDPVDCTGSSVPTTSFTEIPASDLKICVGSNSGSTGLVASDHYIYFPGETATTAPVVDKAFCLQTTRAGLMALSVADIKAMTLKPLAPNKVVAITTLLKTCAIKADGTPEAIAATTLIEHNKVKTDARTICQSMVFTNSRKQEPCAATELCDRYLDVLSDDTTAPKQSCVLPARQIPHGKQAVKDTTYRCIALNPQTAATDIASTECATTTAGEEPWCNPGKKKGTALTTQAERCVPFDKRLGTGPTFESSILAKGAANKICIGRNFFHVCAHETDPEVCNPYASLEVNICLKAADVMEGDAAHGKTGTTDATATPATVSWCVPHTLDADFATTTAGLEAKCKKTTEVCNKASKDVTKTCILKADLIGSITADWTHLGQLRKPAKKIDDTKGDQWCFAKTGTPVLYFAAQCVSAIGTADKPTNTICNPNAKILGDVCIEAYKTLEHGEMATEVKRIVIGDSYYKKDCTFATGSETVANWGAGEEADLCIAKKELLNEAEPLNALRTDAGGEDTDASPLKVCMSKKKTDGTNGYQRCKIDKAKTDEVETEVCNPHGAKGGSDHTLICVLKTRVLGRGEVVTKDDTLKKNICIGVDASSTCSVNEACDLTKGTCFMAAGTDSIVLAPWTEAVEGGAANTCVGKETTEKCTGPGYWCNPLGTTADGTVTVDTAKETSICLFADALHINGGSICLTYAEGSDKTLPDVISAIKCGTDEPFCDDEGTCSATETIQEVVDPVVDPVVDYAATTSIWIGVAIAATLW